MAAKYYRKSTPNVPIIVNGVKCQFTTLDGVTGYFSTDNAPIQQQFNGLISNGLFQMSEMSWEEFDRDFLKKKASTSLPLKPVWREEISNKSRPPIRPSAKPVAAVNEVTKINVAMEGDDFNIPVKPKVEAVVESVPLPFTPTVGRRNLT